jgi:hypothetical protein
MTYNIQKPIKMDFSIKVEAADFPKRELSGRIVTYEKAENGDQLGSAYYYYYYTTSTSTTIF